jgi:uncharacterized protein (DUF1800 family)
MLLAMTSDFTAVEPIDPAHIVEALLRLVQSDPTAALLKPRLAAVSVDDDGIVTLVFDQLLPAERPAIEALERGLVQIAGVRNVQIECSSR